jgi:hypothetical protein
MNQHNAPVWESVMSCRGADANYYRAPPREGTVTEPSATPAASAHQLPAGIGARCTEIVRSVNQIVVLTMPDGALSTPAALTDTTSKYQVPGVKLLTT